MLTLHPLSALLAAAISIGGSILFCLPLLSRLNQIDPAVLFQEAARPKLVLSRRQIYTWLPALTVYWLLACWQAHSWRIGSLFVLLFVGAGAISAGFALACMALIERRLRQVR